MMQVDSYINPLSLLEVSLVEDAEKEVMIDGPMRNEENGKDFDLDPLSLLESVNDCVTSWDRSSALQMIDSNKRILSQVSAVESDYRKSNYACLDYVLNKRLHCTICDAHIGCTLALRGTNIVHPLFKVLICTSCYGAYIVQDFPLRSDNRDMRCRWCSKTSEEGEMPGLRFCQNCPFAICEMCIFRNFPLDDASKAGEWLCPVCHVSGLWPARAIAWALMSLLRRVTSRKVWDPKYMSDVSQCCQIPSTPRNVFVLAPVNQMAIPSIRPNPTRNLQNPQNPPTTVKYRQLQPKTIFIQSGNNFKKLTQVDSAANQAYILPRLLMAPQVTESVDLTEDSNGFDAGLTVDMNWLKNNVNDLIVDNQTADEKMKALSRGLGEMTDYAEAESRMKEILDLMRLKVKQIKVVDSVLRRAWAVRSKSKPKFKPLLPKVKNVVKKPLPVPVPEKVAQKQKSDTELLAEFNIRPCYVRLDRSSLLSSRSK